MAGSQGTITGVDGRYAVTGLSPGAGLALSVTRSGFLQANLAVTVTAGQTATQNVGLVRLPASGVVSGTISDDSSGAPLAGVQVTIGSVSTTSDLGGAYQVTGVAPGTGLALRATRAGYFQREATVEVSAGQVTTRDLALTAIPGTGAIGGIVSDSRSSLPLEGVVVTIGGFSARTDTAGRYGLTGVATGTGLAITASKAGYYQSTGVVEVAAGLATAHDIALAHVVGGVAGLVTDWKTGSPVEGATVSLAGATRVTDALGAYAFAGLLPGTGLPITAARSGYLDFAGTVDVVADQVITKDFSIILNPCLPNPCGLAGTAHGSCTPNGPLPLCSCDATWALPLCAACDAGFYLEGGACRSGLGIYVSTSGDDTTGDGSASKPYRTVTKGLSGALPHTVVRVAAGSYGAGETFPLRPGDGVSIVGDGAAVTSITGSVSVSTGIPIGIVNYQDRITLPEWTRLEGLTLTNTIGLGVFIYYEAFGDVNISPVIRRNVINGTETGSGNGLRGALGILGHSYNNPNAFISPTISDNVITGTGMPALQLIAYEGAVVAPLLTGNALVANFPQYASGAVTAVYLVGGSPRLDHNTITATNATGVWMTSYYLASPLSPTFVANRITWTAPASGIGAGVFLNESQTGTGALNFVDNTIVGTGGAAFMVSSNDPSGTVAVDLGGGGSGSPGRNTLRGSTDLDNRSNPGSISISATRNWWSDSPPTRIVSSTTAGVIVTTAPANAQALAFTSTPASGAIAGGETVTLVAGPGTYFVDAVGASRDRITVTVGGAPATNVSVTASGNQLTAVTPPGVAGATQVVVTNPAGQTGPAAFTYLP